MNPVTSNAVYDALNTIQTFTVTPNTSYCSIYDLWNGTCYRIGHFVFLNVTISITTAGQGERLFTVPSGFRPKYTQNIPLGTTTAAIKIDTNGDAIGWFNTGNIAISVVYYSD